MKYLILLLMITVSLLSFASEDDHNHDEKTEKEHHHDERSNHDDHDDHGDHHAHGSTKAIGEGKAITVVDEEKGFSLSKESLDFMQVNFKNAIDSIIEIPKEALVISRRDKGIYRLRKGFLKFVPVKNIQEKASNYQITLKDGEFGDRIAITRTDLLRVADIYSTDTAEYGHSH